MFNSIAHVTLKSHISIQLFIDTTFVYLAVWLYIFITYAHLRKYYGVLFWLPSPIVPTIRMIVMYP